MSPSSSLQFNTVRSLNSLNAHPELIPTQTHHQAASPADTSLAKLGPPLLAGKVGLIVWSIAGKKNRDERRQRTNVNNVICLCALYPALSSTTPRLIQNVSECQPTLSLLYTFIFFVCSSFTLSSLSPLQLFYSPLTLSPAPPPPTPPKSGP